MNNSDKNNFVLIADFISNTLKSNLIYISDEYVSYINKYLKYDEYEMSFEILLLELINANGDTIVDCAKALNYAKQLRLDTDSIYDNNFFEKLQAYCARKSHL